MDLEQKFTEEINNITISLTHHFHYSLHTLDWKLRVDIMRQIESILDCTKVSSQDESFYVGGVSLIDEPFFFVVEYYNDPITAYSDSPVIDLIDIMEISCDEYLDLINESNTIKKYGEARDNYKPN